MEASISSIRLLPCGHSIGLNVLQKDFTIVDFVPVLKPNGLYFFPAREGGLRIGDVILEVEGKLIKTEQDMCSIINNTVKEKENIELTIRRHEKVIIIIIKPFFYHKTKNYKLGIKLKALTTGIGTLTFYDPVTMAFGALGHTINNLPDGPITSNAIVSSTISSIKKGKPLKPGKKIGYLNRCNEFIGLITHNCESGIFGTVKGKISNPYTNEPIPVASKKEIHHNRAYIYTVIEGRLIEKFDILIEAVRPFDESNKDIDISIIDSVLEKRTGGVILGMSGSPIIQDNQIIGAISHLSYTNSLKGYAVSLENMLKQSQLLTTA